MSNRLPRLCLSAEDIAEIERELNAGNELVYVLDNGHEVTLTPVEADA
ncbi:hypothetical protein [Streptomyces noursei]|nr:hypothetical protein [Streptomyces noursei]MCZ1019383.1 hypothetical protein [Streptomyces noursei]GGX08033.1 hypothetical protein GCM10010341_32050 [Streptomyces noursei]